MSYPNKIHCYHVNTTLECDGNSYFASHSLKDEYSVLLDKNQRMLQGSIQFVLGSLSFSCHKPFKVASDNVKMQQTAGVLGFHLIVSTFLCIIEQVPLKVF